MEGLRGRASGMEGGLADAHRGFHLSRAVDLFDDGQGGIPRDASDGPGPRVLVASASAQMTRYVCQGLARLDPPVEAFQEHVAEHVVGRVEELLPVLVVLDADLGEGRGFELSGLIRGSVENHPLRILLLVDGARRYEAERRMAAVGVDALLWKPFNLSQVAGEATRLLALVMPPAADGETP